MYIHVRRYVCSMYLDYEGKICTCTLLIRLIFWFIVVNSKVGKAKTEKMHKKYVYFKFTTNTDIVYCMI